MAEYIDKQEFIEEQRHLYCENCEKRKGIKRGKMRFVYEIGDAPCRSCGYGDVLDDLEDLPAADVWEVVHCADCVHAEESLVSGCVYCNEMERARIKEGFCAWGERKES